MTQCALAMQDDGVDVRMMQLGVCTSPTNTEKPMLVNKRREGHDWAIGWNRLIMRELVKLLREIE